MTVFRGYLLIIKRNIGMIMMYIGIFAGISIAIQNSYLSTGASEGFAAMKLPVAVIDRDGGVLADALRRLMEREQILVEIADDKQQIQEELFYRNVSYILVVPEGAEERLMEAGSEAVQDGAAVSSGEKQDGAAVSSGEKQDGAAVSSGEMQDGAAVQDGAAELEDTVSADHVIESIRVPDSAFGYYVEAQVNMLLNQIRIYGRAGYTMEEACERALALHERKPQITLLDQNGNQGIREYYNYFVGYMPYAFLGAAIMTISQIIMEFKRRDIRRRIESSTVPFWKQSVALLAALCLIGAVIWGICMALQAILYRGGIFTSSNAVYYVLNSVACMLVALALGFLAGMLADSPEAVSGINNVFSLGLCFLGGIFVPLEMLGGGVKKVAQFLPTYWYSTINGILGDYTQLSGAMTAKIRTGLLIQILFALACFAVALVVRRGKMQEA